MPLLGPLVAYLPTPRTPEGRLHVDVLQALVDRAAAGRVGVAVLGSVGGAPYLDRATRRDVVAAAVTAAAGRVPVVAGVGGTATEDVLRYVDDACVAGADALLLAPVSYLPLTDDEVVGLVRTVAERAGAPVWIYHNPVTTRFAFDVGLLAELLHVPGVQGVKDRGADAQEVRTRTARLLSDAPPHAEVGFSGEVLGATALLAGAATWHSALASLLPGPYARAAAAAVSGDHTLCTSLLAALTPLAELAAGTGGLRMVHALGEEVGLPLGPPPAPVRLPPADVVARAAGLLRRVVEEHGGG